jgi:hypothetical protein
VTLDLAETLRSADLTELVDVHGLPDDRLKVLWLLAAARLAAGIHLLSGAEVSAALRDVFGVHVPRQRVQAILAHERTAVAPRRRDKRAVYQIMDPGLKEIERAGARVVFIQPEEALSKLREAEEVLGHLEGHLKVCDPYVDGRTLDLLTACRAASSISILTVNVKKTSAFARDRNAFERQYKIAVGVRVAARGVLHDRYIVHRQGVLVVGTSLNSLGLKQSFVIALGSDIAAGAEHAFDLEWAKAAAV